MTYSNATHRLGRPPGLHPRRCAQTNANGRPCNGGALWTLIDIGDYCHTHIPITLHAIDDARRQAWTEQAANLWRDIRINIRATEGTP